MPVTPAGRPGRAGSTPHPGPVAGAAHTRTLTEDPLGGTIRRTVLPSGLRILTEAVPAMRSVSVGVWVAVGSRDETANLSGVSHFLEHLLFKGTRRRSALEISATVEIVAPAFMVYRKYRRAGSGRSATLEGSKVGAAPCPSRSRFAQL